MGREELIFRRSNKGIYELFKESLKILEYSIMMVEYFELKEFNNVIAIQLRIILCDTYYDRKKRKTINNSLLKKINTEPKLFPVNDNFVELDKKGSAFIHGELFDYSKEKIPLEDWLNQVIYKINLGESLHELTIKDFIKESANKNGGAHVDVQLPEKAFIVDVHSKRVLCDIARGVFRSLGRNFEENIIKNFTHLFRIIDKKR